MEKKFKREINSLKKIFSFVDEFASKNKIGKSGKFTTRFVVEELFTNMVKYNTASLKDISIGLGLKKNKIIMKLIDYESKPFDITRPRNIDIKQSLKERKAGGLGIHLVQLMVDKITYQHVKGRSQITVIKNME
ncbi:MAG TPA: ATP-binding protein [Bacteroidota bacterium]|nr:ATP-binding protein [Bacteroidota bacterium]